MTCFCYALMHRAPVISQVAIALEKAALSDEYFVKRKLYPNVDFYSGLIYRCVCLEWQLHFAFFVHCVFGIWLHLWHYFISSNAKYSIVVIRAMGFPPEFFTVLFAVPRMAGYLSHWRESLDDPDTKIMRPAQVLFYLHYFQLLENENCCMTVSAFGVCINVLHVNIGYASRHTPVYG